MASLLRNLKRIFSHKKKSKLNQIKSIITRLQENSTIPYILYYGSIDDLALELFYEVLQITGQGHYINLIIISPGGKTIAAKKIFSLIKSYAEHIHLFIPRKACSAATILALGAHEIRMCRLAELSPIDPKLMLISPQSLMKNSPISHPLSISSKNIKSLPKMVDDWMNIKDENNRAKLLSSLFSHIFPTTLSNLYLSWELTEQISLDLLKEQNDNEEERREIVRKLMDDFSNHNYPISRLEARQIGLNVIDVSESDEIKLETIYHLCHSIEKNFGKNIHLISTNKEIIIA